MKKKLTDNMTNGAPDIKSRSVEINKYIPCIFIFVCLLIQLTLIFNSNTWIDEDFTINAITMGYGDMWENICSDVHPPLYYYILKLICDIFGYNFHVYKIVSIIPLLIENVWLVYLIKNKKLFPSLNNNFHICCLLAMLNLTFNYMEMSVELRMYSWSVFFVTMSCVYLYKILFFKGKRSDFVIFALMGLLACYTHYYALAVELFVYLSMGIAVIVRKDKFKISGWILASLATILGYIPWLIVAIRQVTTITDPDYEYWISFKVTDIFIWVSALFKQKPAVFNLVPVIIIMYIVYDIFINFRKKDVYSVEDKRNIVYAFWCIAVPVYLILLGTVLSVALKPIFYKRYMRPTLGAFYLGVIILVSYLKPRYKWIKPLIIAAGILLMIKDYVIVFSVEYGMIEQFF